MWYYMIIYTIWCYIYMIIYTYRHDAFGTGCLLKVGFPVWPNLIPHENRPIIWMKIWGPQWPRKPRTYLRSPGSDEWTIMELKELFFDEFSLPSQNSKNIEELIELRKRLPNMCCYQSHPKLNMERAKHLRILGRIFQGFSSTGRW